MCVCEPVRMGGECVCEKGRYVCVSGEGMCNVCVCVRMGGVCTCVCVSL